MTRKCFSSTDVDILPRSSHTAGIIGDHMWVYNGYRFSDPKHKHQDLYTYHLKDKTWSRLTQENELIWGHSMVVYQVSSTIAYTIEMWIVRFNRGYIEQRGISEQLSHKVDGTTQLPYNQPRMIIMP